MSHSIELMNTAKWIASLSGACLATLMAASSQAAPTYRVVDLGDLAGGGDISEAFDINDAGQVVGMGYGSNGYQAFLWTASQGMQPIGPLIPGGAQMSGQTSGRAINASGVAVGLISAAPQDGYAFRADANGSTLLPYTAGSALAINDAGITAGSVNGHAAITSVDGQTRVLEGPGIPDLYVYRAALNNAGTMVGSGVTLTPIQTHVAFKWGADGSFQTLQGLDVAQPGNLGTVAASINNAGMVAGYSFVGNGISYHNTGWRPVVWDVNGVAHNLGALPGETDLMFSAFAMDINDAGQVVGFVDSGSVPGGFLWTEEEGMRSLIALVDSADPLKGLVSANFKPEAINNLGQVVGYVYDNGMAHAVMLSPVPEPGTWLLMGLGLAGVLSLARLNSRHRRIRESNEQMAF